MKALDKCLKEMPDQTVPYNIMMIRIAEMYYQIANYGSSPGRAAITNPENPSQVLSPAIPASPAIPYARSAEAISKGDDIMNRLGAIYENDFNYYASLNNTRYFSAIQDEVGQCLAVFRELERIANANGRTEVASAMAKRFEASEKKLYSK
jgi:hypothetical protein